MGTPPRLPVIAGLVDEVTSDYAAHFYDMYIQCHTEKHLTGDRIRILLLNLHFVFRDLIAYEVLMPSARHHHIMAYIIFDIMSDFLIPMSMCCNAGSVCQ